jgi:hypothetical protein
MYKSVYFTLLGFGGFMDKETKALRSGLLEVTDKA